MQLCLIIRTPIVAFLHLVFVSAEEFHRFYDLPVLSLLCGKCKCIFQINAQYIDCEFFFRLFSTLHTKRLSKSNQRKINGIPIFINVQQTQYTNTKQPNSSSRNQRNHVLAQIKRFCWHFLLRSASANSTQSRIFFYVNACLVCIVCTSKIHTHTSIVMHCMRLVLNIPFDVREKKLVFRLKNREKKQK